MAFSPWPPTVVAAFGIFLMLGGYLLIKFQGDATRFIHLGRTFTDPAWTDGSLYVWPASGYDGQFFYKMACDPFAVLHTPHVDNPPYRAQRILYPLAACVMAGGRSPLVPYTLLAVNVMALLLLTYYLSALLIRLNRSPWWSVTVTGSLGLLHPVTLCVAEPMALACLAGAAWATFRNHLPAAIAWLAAACLTREQSLVAVAVFGWYWWTNIGRRAGWVILVPGGIWGMWQIFLRSQYGVFPILRGLSVNSGGLLHGYLDRWQVLVRGGRHCDGAEGAYLIWVLLMAILALDLLLHRRALKSLGAWLLGTHVYLALSLSHHVWEDVASSARVPSLLPLALLLVEAEQPSRMQKTLLMLSLAIGMGWILCDLR